MLYLLIYLFWIFSAFVEARKFSSNLLLDYHAMRLFQSSSVFCMLFFSFQINSILDICAVLGNWILAQQLYERIMDKIIFGKFWLNKDTNFVLFSRTFVIKWYYTIITIAVGFILCLVSI